VTSAISIIQSHGDVQGGYRKPPEFFLSPSPRPALTGAAHRNSTATIAFKLLFNRLQFLKLLPEISVPGMFLYLRYKNKHEKEISQAFFSFTQKINRYNAFRRNRASPKIKLFGAAENPFQVGWTKHIWRRHASQQQSKISGGSGGVFKRHLGAELLSYGTDRYVDSK
jgi:hypothetical protein